MHDLVVDGADLGVKGASVGLAHGQTRGARRVCGGVGGAGPAGGLGAQGLIGGHWAGEAGAQGAAVITGVVR